VLSASVTVDKQLISSIGKGILVFAAVAPGDTEKDADALASKVLKMRLWDDENGGRVGTGFPCTYFSTFLIIDSGNKAFKI
jgi:D-Tyr-tRNAtyr deacylase